MKIKNLFASTLLSLALLVVPVGLVSAQGTSSQLNDAPAASTNNTGQTGTTTNTNDDNGFNWMWLLPFLALPLLFLMKRDNKDRSENRREGYAGAKGGSSRREKDDYAR